MVELTCIGMIDIEADSKKEAKASNPYVDWLDESAEAKIDSPEPRKTPSWEAWLDE